MNFARSTPFFHLTYLATVWLVSSWIAMAADVTSAVPQPAGKDDDLQPGILTPVPAAEPRINGPAIFGVRPGSPFLYAIPVTGNRPMTFSIDGLPDGLRLDSATGEVTGLIRTPGEYRVTLHASNASGKSDKAFRIEVGDKIALTPPMGWNSWNCWGRWVNQDKVLNSAKALVGKGLSNHGWTYINIDDGWQGPRGGSHNGIQPNPKFPDMKGLSDQIHAMGLKFGLYSTPWTLSYAGFVGSACENADGTYDWIVSGNHDKDFHIEKYNPKKAANGKVIQPGTPISFATNDAAQWADWGVDYLKYDWYPNDVKNAETMSHALRNSGRDVVFSLSNSAPFDHAADWARLANSWRTTGDIEDSWASVTKIGFHQEKWAPFAGPGHWNDPDMLVVGQVGWGNPKPTILTHNEQYSHISLWCLLSAPLLIGCDLNKLDDFTVSLLSNDEVLAIDQDSLGKEATPVFQDNTYAVYLKPLEDGTEAVGLFNISTVPQKITVAWSDLKVSVPQKVRDLWQQKDLGNFPGSFSSVVNPHGVTLIKISNAESSATSLQAGK
jgi:alpha-galactosidase